MAKAAAISGITMALLLNGGCDATGYLLHGPAVATGIGAKLLCSAEYVMGDDRDRAFEDMSQYSAILERLDVVYNDAQRSVTASFLGLDQKTATFVPGLGCAIDFEDIDARQSLSTRPLPQSTAPWPEGDAIATVQPELQALVEGIVEEDNAAGLNTRALLVVHQGRVVAEAYGLDTSAQTPLLGWSMAKSLTAVMLGNLEMRGLLDLSAAPGFAGWSEDERSSIRIHHLLTMSDGLDFAEDYSPGDDATAMLFTVPSAADYAMQKSAVFSPGTHFNYSSGTANLLARLYLDTLGEPQRAYDDLLEHLFIPMGFHNAVLEMDASGAFVGSSYLYASARDWARMGQMMLNGGVINGQRIVTEDWVRRATTSNTSSNETAYGYQWWLNSGDARLRFPSLPEDAFFAMGNREQSVMVSPSMEAVIVRLGWTSGSYPKDQRFRRILERL